MNPARSRIKSGVPVMPKSGSPRRRWLNHESGELNF
jgi:hypothetical protein